MQAGSGKQGSLVPRSRQIQSPPGIARTGPPVVFLEACSVSCGFPYSTVPNSPACGDKKPARDHCSALSYNRDRSMAVTISRSCRFIWQPGCLVSPAFDCAHGWQGIWEAQPWDLTVASSQTMKPKPLSPLWRQEVDLLRDAGHWRGKTCRRAL